MLAQVVRAYKYENHQQFELLLGSALAKAVVQASWWDRVEAVLPVPTHWRHRMDRPFHAAERLAGDVARRSQKPLVPILRRVRGGPHQMGLSFADRLTNIRGAFSIRPGYRLDRARLLIVDDVRTTGATLRECARTLMEAGAAEVYAAVVTVVDGGDQQAPMISPI